MNRITKTATGKFCGPEDRTIAKQSRLLAFFYGYFYIQLRQGVGDNQNLQLGFKGFIKLTHFVCILQLRNLDARKRTGKDIKLIQGPFELARGALIIREGSNVSSFAPVSAERVCFLCVCLFIIHNRTPIDVNQGLLAGWIIHTSEVYPGVSWNSFSSGSAINSLVHVSLEKAYPTLVEDLKVILTLFVGVCDPRGFCHENLVYIRTCDIPSFDPCCYGNSQRWFALQE